MRHWFSARDLKSGTGWSPDRYPVPYGLVPVGWRGWTLTVLWVTAMAVTLGAAWLQDLRTFLLAAVATTAGSVAVLWMLRGRVKPARR